MIYYYNFQNVFRLPSFWEVWVVEVPSRVHHFYWDSVAEPAGNAAEGQAGQDAAEGPAAALQVEQDVVAVQVEQDVVAVQAVV